MSASTTSTHRWQILLGVALTIAVALASALVLGGALRGGAAPVPSAAAQPIAADCTGIGSLVAAASTTTASTHSASPAAVRKGVTPSSGEPAASPERRPPTTRAGSVQNLADDLGAFRLSVVQSGTDRHADIAATVRADLTALRRLCGH